MKILAIQNRMGIGDMVIFLPFIEAISKKYNFPISILVKENSKASEYLEKNKYIDKILILERNNKNNYHDGITGSFNLAKVEVTLQVAVIIPEHPSSKPFKSFDSEPGIIEKLSIFRFS